MEKINLTCIECPLGCDITVEKDSDTILTITGNTCPRGAKYAGEEVVCPRRVLTTTVKTDQGKMLPVKSKDPIEKKDLFVAVEYLNGTVAKTPVSIGDKVTEFKGVAIVACMNM